MDKRNWSRTQGKYAPGIEKPIHNKHKNEFLLEDNSSISKNKRYLRKKPINKDNHHTDINFETDKKQLFGSDRSSSQENNFEHSIYQAKTDIKDNSYLEFERLPRETVITKVGYHCLSDTRNGKSTIIYEPDFMDQNRSTHLLKSLSKEIKWLDKNVIIDGKERPQPRLVAWFGPLPYKYSGIKLEPKELPPEINEIKKDIENFLKQNNVEVTLNSVLLNLYRDGKDSVAWHSDDEISMGIQPTIASISLGETRRFEMRKKPWDKGSNPPAEYVVHLTHGSLIVMDGAMQSDWQHRVPKEYHDKEKRINLTFRTVHAIERVPRSQLQSYKNVVSLPQVKDNSVEPFEFHSEAFPALDSAPFHSRPFESKCSQDVSKKQRGIQDPKNELVTAFENLALESNSLSAVCQDVDDGLSNAFEDNVESSCNQVQSLDSIDKIPSENEFIISSEENYIKAALWPDISKIEPFVPRGAEYMNHDSRNNIESDESLLNDKLKEQDFHSRIYKNRGKCSRDIGIRGKFADQPEIKRLYSNYDYIDKFWDKNLFRKYERDELHVLMKVVEHSERLPIDVIILLSKRMELLIKNAKQSQQDQHFFRSTNRNQRRDRNTRYQNYM